MAKSRHLARTGQISHTMRARSQAVEAEGVLDVELELGKKNPVSIWRQAACSCHAVDAAMSDNGGSQGGHGAGRSSG